MPISIFIGVYPVMSSVLCICLSVTHMGALTSPALVILVHTYDFHRTIRCFGYYEDEDTTSLPFFTII